MNFVNSLNNDNFLVIKLSIFFSPRVFIFRLQFIDFLLDLHIVGFGIFLERKKFLLCGNQMKIFVI